MRIVATVLVAFLMAGCIQGSPGNDDEDGFAASCPSWIKYPHPGQTVTPGAALLWYNDGQTASYDIEQWDFAGPGELQGSPGGVGFGTGMETYEGHPLDFLVFDFKATSPLNESKRLLYVQDAEVQLQFILEEDGAPSSLLSAYDVSKGPSSAKDTWTFRSDAATGFAIFNVTFHIDLASPTEDPSPHGVFAYWTWKPDLDDNEQTASVLQRGYSPELWYRTCSSDGTKV